MENIINKLNARIFDIFIVICSYFKNTDYDEILLHFLVYVCCTPSAIVLKKQKWIRVMMFFITLPYAMTMVVLTMPVILILLLLIMIDII